MKKLQLQVHLTSYSSENELPKEEQLLVQKAKEATYKSYAPYSNFHVGAALLMEDGSIITANNQENAAFPSGSCAERSAIFWAGANYPDLKIKTIAVLARPGKGSVFQPVSPCGNCRQSMLEYEHRQKETIRLLMLQPGGGIIATESIADLLPVKFDADDLFGKLE